MNRNRFRVIFSKTLARLVVVSEKSKSDGKSSGFSGFSPSDSDSNSNQDTTLSSSRCTKTILYTAIITSLLGISNTSLANIKADPAATNNQKPIIAATKNSAGQAIPVVQIQTPNQGISHNKYSQFDVHAQGAILNNARTGSQTQLAGAVAGNPFLKQGEAHTIINEVRSNKASQLTGTLEVAGQKAKVIIANPSGINVAGANFINVHEATLSTGHIAHQEQGRFSHNITQGSITINAPKTTANSNNNTSNNPNNIDKQIIGLGETHTADYVNLYAKAVSINAQIQAEHAITAVAGSNQISDTGHITPNPNQNSQATTTNTNKNPTTAIDVKLLGGMSAGSITLIGTDKGMGVNTAGALTAKRSIHISSDGKITHAGKSQAQTGGINLASNTAIEIGQHNSPNNNQAAVQNPNLQANTNITLSAPTITANQAVITTKTGDIGANAKQNLTFTNSTLTAGKNIEVIVANANSNQANNQKQKYTAILTNNTLTTKGHITTANLHGDLTHANNKLVATGNISSFANLNQTLTNTTITSKQNSQVSSNQNLNFTNSQISSDKHTTIHTKANQTSTNSQFSAKGVVSDVVDGTYTIKGNVSHQGGAVLIESDSLAINNQDKLNISTTNSALLSARNHTRHLAGDISVQTNKDFNLTNSTKLTQTGNQGDISLISKQGNLTLTSQLNAPKGNISLQGQSVALTAANIRAKQNISVYATDGSVQIDGVRRDFVRGKSTQALPQLISQKQQLEQKINAIKSNPEYIKDKQRLYAAMNDWYYTQKLDKLNRKILLVSQNTSGYEHTPSSLTTQTGDISIHAKDAIIASGANINAAGNITLNAQGFAPNSYEFNSQAGKNSQNLNTSIILDGLQNHYEIGSQGSNHHRIVAFSTPTTLNAGKDINITATTKQPNTHLVLQGSQVAAAGNLAIAANHHLLLDAAIDYEYGYDKTTRKHGKWYKRKYTTTKTINELADADAVSLTANNIRLQTHANKANSHINIYAADMTTTGGDIRLISTGDINLYALTNQHSNEQHSHTKKKLLGIRYNTTDNHNQRQQITALPATLVANYINSRSEGDTTLEGTRFEYLSGASFYAGDKINLLAAISTLQEQAQTDSNSVIWQSIQNTGKIEQSALLPSFTGPTNPTFEAKGGLNVQIPISEKDAQKRQLKDEIITLASQPEYSYLNDLINRDDINWQQVILSNDEWNYKQQGLTGAGAAIVAIAVAYATGGLGSELAASIVSATNSAALGAAGKAALISISQKASISLINNQGNLKAVFKELGDDSTVKGVVTGAVTAGLLEKIGGTDWAKDLGKNTQNGFDDKLFKSIIDSTASALVQTGIQGGSLGNNLEYALKLGLATALESEAANRIKGLEDTNWLLHKIAHAAAGCAAGALQKQCEAGAIGAAVGEVVAEFMPTSDPNLPTLEFQHIQNKNRELAKLVTGVIAAYAGYDVETAVKTADTAIANNRQLHAQEIGILKQEAKLFARSRGISPDEAEIVLYSWVYAQLDTKANNKLNAYLTELASYISGIDYYPNFNPQSDYANLIKHFEAADVVYKKLIQEHGAKPLTDASNRVIKMNNNPVLMFKSTNSQLDNSGAFGVRLGNDNLGISEAINGNSGGANKLIQSSANNYFKSKLQSYQAHHLHTSGQVNPVYPEDVFGAAKVVRSVGKLTLTTLRQKGASVAGRNTNVVKTTCTGGNVCFTAGTLIETSEGLKAIETFTGGELIWTRNDITLEYGYRPVIATKATPDQPIFQVTVKNHQGDIETLETTAEHPFWIKDTGWLKASLLEQGMILLDRNNQEVEVISQYLLPNHTDTVYNIEVDDFHTYHVGRLGVWVHNADCCGVALSTLESHVEKSARGTGKLHNITEPELKQLILGIGYNKDKLLKAKAILEHSIKVRKAEKPKFGGRLDKRHNDRIKMEQGILDKVNSMLKELE